MTEDVHDFVERLATAISNDESSVRITPNDECYRFVSSSLYTLEQSKMFMEINELKDGTYILQLNNSLLVEHEEGD